MRFTRLGWGCLLMMGLTLMSAATTGNNLLYLLYSALLAALSISWIAGRWNLHGVAARAEAPEQVFRGADFPLKIVLRNQGRLPAFALRAACRGKRSGVERIEAGCESAFTLRYSFPHRGLNGIDDLLLESTFPLGLMLHRRVLTGAQGLAFPRLREVRTAAELSTDARHSGRPVLRKGSGDELYGVREHTSEDDSRLINWKLTAKAGRPLVVEFAAAEDSKVTVRLPAVGAGAEAEAEIEEAASACRFYIDSGSEVRLVTPAVVVDYGRGLLHLDKILRVLSAVGEGARPRSAGAAQAFWPPAIHDSRTLRRLTFLGAAVVYASLFLVEEIDPLMLAALAPVLPLGWVLDERGARRVPDWLWNVCSLFVLFYVTLVDWRVSGVTIANTHLLGYLLINRMLSEIKTRELAQLFLILFLAFFLVSGLTISLWYFAYFLLYMAFAGAWLMLASGVFEGRLRAGAPVWAGVVSACLASSAFVFALTPRIEGLRKMNPFTSSGIDKLQAQSSSVIGFTDNVSLGFFGELKRSSARVMRVKPRYAPPSARPAPVRIRGAAFDLFDGRRWSKGRKDFWFTAGGKRQASVAGRAWAPRLGDRLALPAAPSGAGAPVFDFVFYPINLSIIFTIETPSAIERAGDAAYFDDTDSLYFATPYTGGVQYRQYVSPGPLGFGLDVPGYGRVARGSFLQLPERLDPRVIELARKVTAQARGDGAKARAIELYLRRAYHYSTFSDGRGRGVEDFLFSSKKGNCEYFATAGAVLMRAAGVPSRLVTGFFSDEWNEFGRFYDVRQGQAHAWVEAYVAGSGWLTFDPTPPQSAFSAGADALGRRLERWFNAVQANWYRNVIGYDQYVQRNTFLRLGASLSSAVIKSFGRAAVLLLACCALGLWLRASVLGAWKQWRGRERDSFARAQAALERAGFLREACLTPREYARAVRLRRPDLSEVTALAELHYMEAYAGRGLDTGQSARARELLRALKSRL